MEGNRRGSSGQCHRVALVLKDIPITRDILVLRPAMLFAGLVEHFDSPGIRELGNLRSAEQGDLRGYARGGADKGFG